MTQELIDTYPHKNSKWRPNRPYCRLCAVFDFQTSRGTFRSREDKYLVKYLEVGQEAIEVTFRNKTVAYYHPGCWNKPKYARKVANIKAQDLSKS